jgi:Lon protease-like protein
MRQPRNYLDIASLPVRFAVFPLARVLLLPGSQLPLNIFEPRYLAMIDDTLAHDRVVAMIQPHSEQPPGGVPAGIGGLDRPALYGVGCLGRLSSFSETGDGRYHIVLSGICRFMVREELPVTTLYRQVVADFAPFAGDLAAPDTTKIDRPGLLARLKTYLEQQRLGADWKAVESTPTEHLVNMLAMNCPFELPEKQALLEAPDIAGRAATLMTLLQMAVAGTSSTPDATLQ